MKVKRDEEKHAKKLEQKARADQDHRLNSRVAGLYGRLGDIEASRNRMAVVPESEKVDMETRESREQRAEKRALRRARRQWKDDEEVTSRHFNLFAEEERKFMETSSLHEKYLEDVGHNAQTTSDFVAVKSTTPWYTRSRVELKSPPREPVRRRDASESDASHQRDSSRKRKRSRSPPRHSKRRKEDKRAKLNRLREERLQREKDSRRQFR